MEIGTIFPGESLSATQFSTASEKRRQQEKNTQMDGDTVSLSPEALELARQSRLAAFCGAYGTDKLDETERGTPLPGTNRSAQRNSIAAVSTSTGARDFLPPLTRQGKHLPVRQTPYPETVKIPAMTAATRPPSWNGR